MIHITPARSWAGALCRGALSLTIFACAGVGPTVPTQNERRVPPDVWGGEHIAFTVETAGARAEFDCAAGAITTPLTIDGNGRFDVEGTLVLERGGPARSDDKPDVRPARYAGQVTGNAMTLTVELIKPNEQVGSYALERGRLPVLRKCR